MTDQTCLERFYIVQFRPRHARRDQFRNIRNGLHRETCVIGRRNVWQRCVKPKQRSERLLQLAGARSSILEVVVDSPSILI